MHTNTPQSEDITEHWPPQAVPYSAPRSESRADATLAPYKYLLGRAKDGASRSDPVKAGDVLRVI